MAVMYVFDGEFILRELPPYDNGIRECGRYQTGVTYSLGIVIRHKDISTSPWDPSLQMNCTVSTKARGFQEIVP